VHRQLARLGGRDRQTHATAVIDLADLGRLDVVRAVGVVVEGEPAVVCDGETVEDVLVLVPDDEEDHAEVLAVGSENLPAVLDHLQVRGCGS
jgi:hypothetical protein